MRKEVEQVFYGTSSENKKAVKVKIGIHVGDVIAGIIGEQYLKIYT